jgi:hypothetical protein
LRASYRDLTLIGRSRSIGKSRSFTTKEFAMGDQVHGEGNYEATRKYNESTKKFIDAGKVEQAAKDAVPKTPQEARELEQAENDAKAHVSTSHSVDDDDSVKTPK